MRVKLAQSVRAQYLLEQASIGTVNTKQKTSKTLDCCVHLRVFIPTYFLTLGIGCLLLIMDSATNIISGFSQAPTAGIEKIYLGFAMMCIFYNLKRYLITSVGGEKEHHNTTSIFFRVLSKAAPRVIYFLISIMPVMFGYVLCGTIWFGGKVRLFATCAQTLVTLYSLANGDSMVNVFEAVWWSDGWLGYIYLYSYISLIIFVVVNIFLVIVQQTYEDIVKSQDEAEEMEEIEEQQEQHTRAGGETKMKNNSSNPIAVAKTTLDEGSGDGSANRSTTRPNSVPNRRRSDGNTRARASSLVVPPLPGALFDKKDRMRIARSGTEYDDMLKYIES